MNKLSKNKMVIVKRVVYNTVLINYKYPLNQKNINKILN